MINIEKEKEQHKSWYKQDDPIAYQQYRAGGHEFEQDFSQSEKSWLAAKAQAVPEGFVLIPVKQTEKMVRVVAYAAVNIHSSAYTIYDAIVKEAQELANEY